MFVESVGKLLEWMSNNESNYDLMSSIEQYLGTRGEGSMMDIVRGKTHLIEWAQEHDILGWDNFLEGRIGDQLFRVQDRHLRCIQSRRHIKTWAISFIQQVLNITHEQWLYRNTRIHIRLVEGKTAAEHREIMHAVQC